MYTYKIKLTKVIDGDTLECIVDLGFRVSLKERFRLIGIDTPEVRTRDLEEKKLGLKASEFVKDYCEKHKDTLYVKVEGKDKYGRWLGTFYKGEDPQSLNELLLENGLATVYEG